MPTFSYRSPTISDSIALALNSSPNLAGRDILAVETAAQNMINKRIDADRSQALAEKARLEAQQMRDAAAARQDPELRHEFARNSAGMAPALANRVRDAVEGRTVEVHPLHQSVDDAGNPIPGIVQFSASERPQREVYQQALAAQIANQIATGKTNAQQLMQGVQVGQETANRAAMADPTIATEALNARSAAVTGKPVMPYGERSGTVLNKQTGATSATQGATGDAIRTQLAENAKRAAAAANASNALADRRRNAPFPGTGGKAPKPPSEAAQARLNMALEKGAEAAWGALKLKERKTLNEQRWKEDWKNKMRGGSANKPAAGDAYQQGVDAIAGGKDPAAVKARFKQVTGLDWPEE